MLVWAGAAFEHDAFELCGQCEESSGDTALFGFVSAGSDPGAITIQVAAELDDEEELDHGGAAVSGEVRRRARIRRMRSAALSPTRLMPASASSRFKRLTSLSRNIHLSHVTGGVTDFMMGRVTLSVTVADGVSRHKCR